MKWTPIPETLKEAVERLKGLKGLKAFAAKGEDDAVGSTHHFLGMTIRNEWGLWAGSPLAQSLFATLKLWHADDMSALIIRCLHRDLNGRPWHVKQIAKKYHDFWKRQGPVKKPAWAKCKSCPR